MRINDYCVGEQTQDSRMKQKTLAAIAVQLSPIIG